MYKDEFEEPKNNITNEDACNIIESVVKELKDPDRIKIVRKLYYSKYPLSIYTIAEELVNHLNALENLGIIAKTDKSSHENQKYYLTEFGQKLFKLDKDDQLKKLKKAHNKFQHKAKEIEDKKRNEEVILDGNYSKTI